VCEGDRSDDDIACGGDVPNDGDVALGVDDLIVCEGDRSDGDIASGGDVANDGELALLCG